MTGSETAQPMGRAAHGAVAPVAGAVVLGDGVFGRWQRLGRAKTIPHGIARLESSGVLDNLRRLVGRSDAPFRGPVFADSDLHKTLEAVAWELGHGEDAALRAFYEESLELLAAVQDEDGYLDSAFQRADRVQERWSDLTNGHELYCAGHLIQAAVASVRALGDERLLAIATRLADLIVRRFGGAGGEGYDGHPEIEYALVELFRVTGRSEYLDTARRFIDRRGSGWLGRSGFGPIYYQDDAPVRETATMRGHAVRAIYLNSGVADVFLETGDESLLAAARTQWDDMLGRRSYITGGTGSRHKDEAFGDAYELPSDRAYAETCAGIAAMHWAWRMYAATGDVRFGDFFETALYNVVADGIAEDGVHFFYSNPLQMRADHISGQQEAAASRLDWYFCACCPPNLMRTFASLEGYLAAVRDDELQLVQYSTAHVEAQLPSGAVVLDVETDYPASGSVRVSVAAGGGADLVLRIPGWAAGFRVTVNGEAIDADVSDGALHLTGALAAGSVVELDLDMAAVVLAADPRVDAVRGSAAVRRGPVVYCLEQGDNGPDVESLVLDPAAPIEVAADGGAATPLGPLLEASGIVRAPDGGLYAPWPGARPAQQDARLRLRPYATWGNGEPGAMRVWVPAASA